MMFIAKTELLLAKNSIAWPKFLSTQTSEKMKLGCYFCPVLRLHSFPNDLLGETLLFCQVGHTKEEAWPSKGTKQERKISTATMNISGC